MTAAEVYGPPPIMDTLWALIRDSFSTIPGARFFTPEQRKHENDVLKQYPALLLFASRDRARLRTAALLAL